MKILHQKGPWKYVGKLLRSTSNNKIIHTEPQFSNEGSRLVSEANKALIEASPTLFKELVYAYIHLQVEAYKSAGNAISTNYIRANLLAVISNTIEIEPQEIQEEIEYLALQCRDRKISLEVALERAFE